MRRGGAASGTVWVVGVGALWIAASWIAAASPSDEGSPPERAAVAERWLYNPRERALGGLDALRAGRAQEALERFGAATRLAEGDPTTLYDAATARLMLDEQTGRAADLLERAAETAPPDLAPDALYNLGNARLAEDDPAGAAEAYRRALRLAPELRPAKHNLELALGRMERMQERERPPQETPDGERPRDEQRPPESGGQQAEEPDDGSDSQEEDQSGGETPGDGDPERLPPRFEEQRDMTPAQAAALLAAIDNLERRQRRLEAAEAAEGRPGKGRKDW